MPTRNVETRTVGLINYNIYTDEKINWNSLSDN